MLKNKIILTCCFFYSTILLPALDLSPWIVINNATKFELSCQVEAMCYSSDYEDENITVLSNNNGDFSITCNQDQDENENEYIHFTIDFTCAAESIKTFNPIFYHNDKLFNPKITSIAFTHESLQVTAICNPTNYSQRYFSVMYHDESGITTKIEPISMYIKCLNNFKQNIHNFMITALNLTNYLPY